MRTAIIFIILLITTTSGYNAVQQGSNSYLPPAISNKSASPAKAVNAVFQAAAQKQYQLAAESAWVCCDAIEDTEVETGSNKKGKDHTAGNHRFYYHFVASCYIQPVPLPAYGRQASCYSYIIQRALRI